MALEVIVKASVDMTEKDKSFSGIKSRRICKGEILP